MSGPAAETRRAQALLRPAYERLVTAVRRGNQPGAPATARQDLLPMTGRQARM